MHQKHAVVHSHGKVNGRLNICVLHISYVLHINLKLNTTPPLFFPSTIFFKFDSVYMFTFIVLNWPQTPSLYPKKAYEFFFRPSLRIIICRIFLALLAHSWPGWDAQLIHRWEEIGRCENGITGRNPFHRFYNFLQ